MKLLKSLTAAAAMVAMTGAVQAALDARPGGMIYDDVRNTTWLADFNYAQTSAYAGIGVSANGRMTWNAAKALADNLVQTQAAPDPLGARVTSLSEVGGPPLREPWHSTPSCERRWSRRPSCRRTPHRRPSASQTAEAGFRDRHGALPELLRRPGLRTQVREHPLYDRLLEVRRGDLQVATAVRQ